MTAAALLEGLKAQGATVAANGEKLKLYAPTGVLKPRLLDLVTHHKAELLHLLELENPTREYSTPHPPSAADARQAGRIRELAASVSAEELLASYLKIKPLLKKHLSKADLHELALQLAHADQSQS